MSPSIVTHPPTPSACRNHGAALKDLLKVKAGLRNLKYSKALLLLLGIFFDTAADEQIGRLARHNVSVLIAPPAWRCAAGDLPAPVYHLQAERHVMWD